MTLLESLSRSRSVRVIDHALAQSLRRLQPDTPDAVLAAAALASFAVGAGHAAFDPARPQMLIDGDIDWPRPDAWCALLSSSRWVGTPDQASTADPGAPLVLDHGLLYLRRYREYEHRLAQRLQRLSLDARRDTPSQQDLAALAPLFGQLFPDAAQDGDHQARAAALSLLRSLLLVTGGPGTGKTTTIARLLLLLSAHAVGAGRPAPRIALAAPTGRAAERMADSLRGAVTSMQALPGVDGILLDTLPTSASTLHRLLGTIPDSPRFRHDATHPLPFDVVVVDEASMVDLPLMCKLAESVADGARLILLGDPDQLPSVEAGDVLASIIEAAGPDQGLSADDAELLAPLLGSANDRAADGSAATRTETRDAPLAANPLARCRVQLQRGYRQSGDFDLAPLATAMRDGDADQVLELLRGSTLQGVHFHEDVTDPLALPDDLLLRHWRGLAEAADPARALVQAGRLRLLTAVREGPQGARTLNARIENALVGPRGGGAHFKGRLLLVTENSYRHRLFNGDIGICLPDESGAMVAWFAGEAGSEVRGFHPATLPAHDSAFAMTVHKAQGSEFDSVWLAMPARPGRGLSRELLYTAITRARRELHLCASEPVLRFALATDVARVSGLAARLG